MTGLISIILPNYNSEPYIAQTLNSVQAQTYENWELVVVDDCSTDGSSDIIEDYAAKDSRIRFHSLSNNSGLPAVPRNRALDKSAGEFVAFLDADDIWHPAKLALQVHVLSETGLSFCSTALRFFKNIEEIEWNLATSPPELLISQHLRYIPYRTLLKKNVTPNSSVLCRKELFDGIRFSENPAFRAIEDYHCWLSLHRRFDTSVKVLFPLLFYRLSETAISRSKFYMLRRNASLYTDHFRGNDPLRLRTVLYLCCYVFYSIRNRLLRKEV